MNEIFALGGHLKAFDGHVIAGLAVVFSSSGSPDRTGEYFSSVSDFDLEDRGSIKAYWHHRQDPSLAEPLGRATFQLRPQAGLWAELKLPNNQVGERIYTLAQKNALGWSSGSVSHLVRREKVGTAFHLIEWPISEFSVLPIKNAAESRARAVALKSYYDSVIAQPSPEQRAAEIYAECIVRGIELRTREFETSQHADDASEMQSYYSALADLKLRQHEARMKAIRRG